MPEVIDNDWFLNWILIRHWNINPTYLSEHPTWIGHDTFWSWHNGDNSVCCQGTTAARRVNGERHRRLQAFFHDDLTWTTQCRRQHVSDSRKAIEKITAIHIFQQASLLSETQRVSLLSSVKHFFFFFVQMNIERRTQAMSRRRGTPF